MTSTSLMPDSSASTATIDPATERVRAIWTAGDFGRVARGYVSGAAEFIARLHLTENERVLDVACGTGNLALPAARTGAATTGIDIAPNLVAQAVANAAVEGLDVRFEVGDAEEMPYADGSFDTVVSMFGVMFAPRPLRASAELLRVTRPGGRIALANWTPDGFVGRMLRLVTSYAPPAPAGSVPVLQWGDEPLVRERLGGVERIDFVRRRIMFDYPWSPADTVRLFRDWYGPIVHVFARLDLERRVMLERELVALWSDYNHANDGATRVESEYLEVIAVR